MINNHARLLGKCKCTYVHSVVADNNSLIVLGPLVVHHAASQLVSVRPDQLGVVTSAGAEPEDNHVTLLTVAVM